MYLCWMGKEHCSECFMSYQALNQIRFQVRNTSSVCKPQKVRPHRLQDGLQVTLVVPGVNHHTARSLWLENYTKSSWSSHQGNHEEQPIASTVIQISAEIDHHLITQAEFQKVSHLLILLHNCGKLNQKPFSPTTTAVLRSYSDNYSRHYFKHRVPALQPSEISGCKACDNAPANKREFEP